MNQDLPPGVHAFRPVDDPLADWPKEAPIPVRLVEPGFAPASAVPEGVTNWDYYDGAIVMVGITDGETYTVEGSGVMVAPGLVLSATHVLRDHADAIADRKLSVYCIGVRSSHRAGIAEADTGAAAIPHLYAMSRHRGGWAGWVVTAARRSPRPVPATRLASWAAGTNHPTGQSGLSGGRTPARPA